MIVWRYDGSIYACVGSDRFGLPIVVYGKGMADAIRKALDEF